MGKGEKGTAAEGSGEDLDMREKSDKWCGLLWHPEISIFEGKIL